MASALDLAFLAVLAVAWPLYEYFVDWSTFQRWLREKPRHARLFEYWRAVGVQWLLAATGAWLWIRAGRPLPALGLDRPEGWRLWLSALLVLLLSALHWRQALAVARRPRLREHLRRRLADLGFGELLPRTPVELGGFIALSFSAGVCEELLFRGYFIGALAPWLGWWGAAALGIPVFGLLHAYQGRRGIVNTALVGVAMTLVVAATRSLVPAMALHALVDIGSGLITYLAIREETAQVYRAATAA